MGYIIYQTFAWSDRNGRPISEKHEVTYQELIGKAGISRGALAQAISEAVNGNFITIKRGQPDKAGKQGESTLFELKWSADPEYVKNPRQFKGFFEGNGNRTYIPNQFFTRILPNEPLVVIKVVGSVIRFSIGFQVKRGFRRQEVSLSYREIQHYANIRSPHDLSKALHHAVETNYIHYVELGYFDPNAGKKSKATVYSLKWAQDKRADSDFDSSSYEVTGSKSVAGEKDNRFKIRSGTGSKKIADNRFKIRSDIEIKQINKTSKQQQDAVAEISLEDKESFGRLREAGFDNKTASLLASVRSLEHIEQQIAWLPKRHSTKNPLGLLRKAIEEDWSEPVNLITGPTAEDSPEMVFGRHFYAGLGRNDGTPVAMPSRMDILATEPFVTELLNIWPNPNRIADWGRQFGLQAAERKSAETYPMSLTGAIRQFGNGFVVWTRNDRERQLRQFTNQSRENYEGQFKADYLRYVAEIKAEYRKTNPEAYREFLAYREARKAEIEKIPGDFIRRKLLHHYNNDTAITQDFIRYFPEVADFWKWDAQYNRQHQVVA
ncbi:MAG: hypothetical protein ACREUI_04460 [Burkholderiales bacterium]